MQKTSSCNVRSAPPWPVIACALLAWLLTPPGVGADQHWQIGEQLSGFYARDGNNDSPAKTAGNNIYIKFFPERWIVMLFVPYPYAQQVNDSVIDAVFAKAKRQTDSASYLRNKFGLLEQAATAQVERYGYLGDRIMFECGAMSSCSVRIGDGFLELIKPGVINEHITRFNHSTLD